LFGEGVGGGAVVVEPPGEELKADVGGVVLPPFLLGVLGGGSLLAKVILVIDFVFEAIVIFVGGEITLALQVVLGGHWRDVLFLDGIVARAFGVNILRDGRAVLVDGGCGTAHVRKVVAGGDGGIDGREVGGVASVVGLWFHADGELLEKPTDVVSNDGVARILRTAHCREVLASDGHDVLKFSDVKVINPILIIIPESIEGDEGAVKRMIGVDGGVVVVVVVNVVDGQGSLIDEGWTVSGGSGSGDGEVVLLEDKVLPLQERVDGFALTRFGKVAFDVIFTGGRDAVLGRGVRVVVVVVVVVVIVIMLLIVFGFVKRLFGGNVV